MNSTPTFQLDNLGRITVDLRLNEVHFHQSQRVELMRQNEDGDWVFSHPGWEGEYRLQCLGPEEWLLQHQEWTNIARNIEETTDSMPMIAGHFAVESVDRS